jgi:DNA primase
MTEDVELLVELLSDFLGKKHRHYESKGQISFDCPVCAQENFGNDGKGKGNLEINYFNHVYKCWACGDTHGTHGPLGKLFSQFATKSQKKTYDILKPEELKIRDIEKPKLKLPDGYTLFEDSNPRFIPHIEAYRYLVNRGVTDDIIKKYKIGYAASGDFAYCVIIPSYDVNGELNYYIGRSWIKGKVKYKNAVRPKDEIIFNENMIDWNQDIYLVEGVFDGFFLNNSIVMLGKRISGLLFSTIYEKLNGNVHICVDGDAFSNGLKMYHELNGGRLYNKVKLYKLPQDKDVCDLRGKIDEFYYEIR